MIPKVYNFMILGSTGGITLFSVVARNQKNALKRLEKYRQPKDKEYALLEESWFGVLACLTLPVYSYKTKNQWSEWGNF